MIIIDNIEYEITNSTSCKVVGYIGIPVQVVIPEEVEINGKKYKVTSLGNSAFSYCKSLTSIDLPSGITSLGDRAFYYCKSLTSIALPSGITSLGDEVFSGCENLTSIDLPSGITSIGASAFYDCKSLPPHLLIYDKGTKCYGWVGNRRKCVDIHIPDTVTSIGYRAFYDCENLTSIDLPSGITSLGDRAFEGCKSLTSIALPSGITSLGDDAFENCYSLTSIELPSGITSIGEGAFEGCTSLVEISIPDSVTHIGEGAFWGCENLTSIDIPESVKFIGEDVFAWTNISCLKKEGTYLHFLAECDDEDAISLDEWLQIYNRKKELNEFAVNAIIENVKENCPNGEFLEVTNIGTDCCELSLIFDDLTLWKSVFKTEELQDNLGLIKEKAANYKAVLELKNETGGKYLKLTGLGTDCCELSLIVDDLTLWKSVFKTEELQDNLGLIKEKAANYKALYEEAPKA